MDRSEALVDVEWLSQHLHDDSIRVVDVRWFLPSTGRSARAEYSEGHVPGATFVDLDHELASHGGTSGGRHPLPAPEAFALSLGSHGIEPASHVIAYDDSAGSTAARLWWMMRQIGHTKVSVVDGGFAAWRAADKPLETGNGFPRAVSSYPATSFGAFGPIIARDEILPAISAGAVLIDARAPERFEGRIEPIDPRAGHIPGARNLPFSGNVSPDASGVARFLPPEVLRERFAAAGATNDAPVILSCGSGVTACHNALAMHLAGFTAPGVYVGSWSDWSTQSHLPVETGPDAGPNG